MLTFSTRGFVRAGAFCTNARRQGDLLTARELLNGMARVGWIAPLTPADQARSSSHWPSVMASRPRLHHEAPASWGQTDDPHELVGTDKMSDSSKRPSVLLSFVCTASVGPSVHGILEVISKHRKKTEEKEAFSTTHETLSIHPPLLYYQKQNAMPGHGRE